VTEPWADRWTDGLDGELRADALDVLRDVLEWRLTGLRWTAVTAALEAMSAALPSGDVASFRAAVYELELAGPLRATGFGDTPSVDPPLPVREEVNELILILDGRQVVEPEE
jgi:hypothetical protein